LSRIALRASKGGYHTLSVQVQLGSQLRVVIINSMTYATAHALLIGVGNYAHAPNLNVPVTVADASAVAAVLRDPQYCGYPSAQVMLLSDAAASRHNILHADKICTSVMLSRSEASLLVRTRDPSLRLRPALRVTRSQLTRGQYILPQIRIWRIPNLLYADSRPVLLGSTPGWSDGRPVLLGSTPGWSDGRPALLDSLPTSHPRLDTRLRSNISY
ncbi:MAG TPA: hypothetical protein VF897_04220, partial [Roseiflexaceae bacterium]